MNKEKDVVVFMFEDRSNMAIFIKQCIIDHLISEMKIIDNNTFSVRLTAPGIDRIWKEAKLANLQMIIKNDTYEKHIVKLNDIDPTYSIRMKQSRITMESVFVCKHEFSAFDRICIKCGKTQENYHKTISVNDNDYFTDIVLNGKLIERTKHHK